MKEVTGPGWVTWGERSPRDTGNHLSVDDQLNWFSWFKGPLVGLFQVPFQVLGPW